MGTLELKVKTMEEGVRFAWDVGIRDIILVWLVDSIQKFLVRYN